MSEVIPSPPKLSGKEFEEYLLKAADRGEAQQVFCMDRYGVEVSFFGGRPQVIPSKVDFEGTRSDGKQFMIEAKVCSQATFQVCLEKLKPRQVKHMLKRSRFGSKCFLLIHFNELKQVKKSYPAITIAIPVNDEDPRWQQYVDAYADSKRTKTKMAIQDRISREEAEEIGHVIKWVIPENKRTPTPDLAPIIWPEFFEIIIKEVAQPLLFPKHTTTQNHD